MNHNIATCETAIDAKILYPYAGEEIPYEDWINEIKRMPSGLIGSLAVEEGVRRVNCLQDGRTLIETTFAASLLMGFSNGFPRAIPLIAIAENLGVSPPAASISWELVKYSDLAIKYLISDPELLHEYLGVEMDYETWIGKQIQKFRMKSKRGYRRSPDGSYVIILIEAQRIALYENTKRAEQVRICISSMNRRHTECPAELSEVFEQLLNATAQKPDFSKHDIPEGYGVPIKKTSKRPW
ncbi:MAG: hypothetical protein RLZZ505_2759 [Verrucomicrobiota bacterium]|jgi:phage anti-repressor protein